ncbi:MAG: UvrD-helicase domain-containing protein [Arcobacteraceae bacterium]
MSNLNKFTIQKSFAISAGAGSGKTYTLSRRYINALLGFDYFREDYDTQKSYFEALKPALVNEVVTITYTEAAALEMKGRIFELVSKILDDDLAKDDEDFSSIQEANTHITNEQNKYVKTTLKIAFQNSSNAKISTIHAYCLNIIKSNADIARIDTKLDMIQEDEKQKELSTIIFDVLNDTSNEPLVLDISKDIGMFFITDLINRYVSNSKFRADFNSFNKNSIALIDYKKVMFELYPLPDIKEDLDTVKEYILENLKEDAQKYVDFINDYITKVFNFEAQSWGSLSKENDLLIQFNRKPWTQHKDIKENIDAIKQLDGYIDIYSTIEPQKEKLFFAKIEQIKQLLHQIKSKYDAKLIELGKIDFDTIITKTLEIMPKVQTNFKYIMVDEFQDTNATQFDIIKNSKASNLFVVGDSKQAIYSFQGAEIEVFNDAVNDTNIFSSIEDMSQNYRSDFVVLDTVNKIFEKLLQKDDNLNLISQNYEAQTQDLTTKKEGGSFRYLITSQPNGEEINELDTIANFIEEIYHDKNSDYSHISQLIEKKEKAIAIIFDSSTKMLELKLRLREKGITAKVSASDNFYHTKEINDIFNVLKAIDILSRNKEELSNKEKYYISGAMRSNILRIDDNQIKNYLDTNTNPEKLHHYAEVLKTMPLSLAVKYIYDDANIFGVYTHFEDIEQRIANLYKFLSLCQDFENSDERSLYKFLSLIENAIYFSEAKEDEAFFQSPGTKSIEICSIHSTKGLAYPLVLLGHSEKGLYGQIQSDALKHNNFTLNEQKKEIVGFKINDYTPLSHRVLKQIDKLKHLAEKKRLLYVALTRAQHDVVISAQLKQTKSGTITLREDSYLQMICESLSIEKEELFEQNEKYCIKIKDETENTFKKNTVEYINHTVEKISFEKKNKISATQGDNSNSVNETAATLGTLTHEMIENYWETFDENHQAILDKKMIFDTDQREQIFKNMQNFYNSDIYRLLKDGVEHRFEMEFNVDDKIGFIDFIYYDESKNGWVIVDFKTGKETQEKNLHYQKQLNFYRDVIERLEYRVVDTFVLWLE